MPVYRLLQVAACIGLLAISCTQAHAIPAFTRANKVECSTCHTVFPALNEYGDAFQKNSYVYFGKGHQAANGKDAAAALGVAPSEPATERHVEAALPSGGETKPEGILLAAIPELLPISFIASINAAYDQNAANELDLSTRALKLNAGGNFREMAAFFASYVAYSENTSNIASTTSSSPANNNTDINELFFIWRHAFDTPVNIRVGRMQPKLALWKSNNRMSVTNSFAPYSYTVGISEFSIEQPQDALEASAVLGKRFFAAGGVVNRKHQNTKEGYGHVSYKIGGADFLGNEPEVDLDKEESIFDFLTATIGVYGYYGKNGTPNTTAGVSPVQNQYYRTGVDLEILYKLVRLRLAGVLGDDDNAFLTASPTRIKSYAAALEGEYTFRKNLVGAFRFEYQDDGREFVRRYIPTLGFTPLQNVKVALEYKHEIANSNRSTLSSNAQDFTNRIGTLNVTFGF